MKTLFVEARSNVDISIDKKFLKKLPEKLALATTVQHIHKLNDLKKYLEKNGKKVILLKGKHSKYAGQILGCDFVFYKDLLKKTDAVLYVGTGGFHPIDLTIKSGKDVFVYNPLSKNLDKTNNEEIEKIKKRRKGALIKFLSSENIGILVSTKSGQYNMKFAEKLEKKYENKRFCYFLFDTLNFSQLENFPFIECFVNTTCPRIMDDSDKIRRPMINVDEVL